MIKIPEHWRRICGIHAEENGVVGCVFLGHDMQTSIVHCYDCCKFDREVMAVIGQGISGRGKWIPVAYRKQDEEFAKKLLDYGCNVLPDPHNETPAIAEVMSREIWQRLRASQFRIEAGAAEFRTEAKNANRQDGKVPLEGFPLMGATRHAIEMLSFARGGAARKPTRQNGTRMPI